MSPLGPQPQTQESGAYFLGTSLQPLWQSNPLPKMTSLLPSLLPTQIVPHPQLLPR